MFDFLFFANSFLFKILFTVQRCRIIFFSILMRISFCNPSFNLYLRKVKIPALIIICVLFFACQKEKPLKDGDVVAGKSTLTAFVKHHGWGIGNAQVFIAKNSSSVFPGNNPQLYYENKTADSNGVILFDKLSKGNYWLYAKGFDTAIADSVQGYTSFYVNTEPGKIKEYETDLPVSE